MDAKEKIRKDKEMILVSMRFPLPHKGGRRFHIFATINFKKFMSKILDDREMKF